MANVNPLLHARWSSGNHVGISRPTQKVEIQRGLIDHRWGKFQFLDGSTEDFGTIVGSTRNKTPWHGYWRPTGAFITVPNTASVQIEEGFDDNGIGHATIVIENVLYKRMASAYGAYTLMLRGGLSPTMGFRAVGRPITDQQAQEWYDVLNGGYLVKVWQGYGDALEPTFAGLIDDTDVAVTPDEITLTCRSFGQLLTDQPVFGWTKPRELKSPIIFADRLKAMDITKVSAGARALTSDSRHPPSAVGRADNTYWLSGPHEAADRTEWIEFHVPRGTYEDFYIDGQYEGLECWVSVKLNSQGIGSCKVDDVRKPDGWLALGRGTVPGDNGGKPWIKHIKRVAKEDNGRRYDFGAKLEVGDNTVIRFQFRGLHKGQDDQYRAGVRRLLVYRQLVKPEAKRRKWILVDDIADVVKFALMWAGFHEWEIESFGARIQDPKVFNQTEYLIDVIKWVEQQGDYRFFMTRPTAHPESIGVPVFRHTRAVMPPQSGMIEVSQKTVLTNLERKFSKEPLAYLIRVRGRMASKKQGGMTSNQDRHRRYQATYYPPWSGAHRDMATGTYDPSTAPTGRMSGVMRPMIHSDNLLASADDCMAMALLIAIQQQLAADTGTIEIPGHPGVELDDQLSVLDSASGTNSRLWIASKSSTFTTGENASWVMSLGGSMIDNADMQVVADDLRQLIARVRSGE